MNYSSTSPPSYSSSPSATNERTSLRPHHNTGRHVPQPTPDSQQDFTTTPERDRSKPPYIMEVLCSVVTSAGLLLTICMAIFHFLGPSTSTPSSPQDPESCRAYINDWESRIADLKHQENVSRQRIKDYDQKLKERLNREKMGREWEYIYWGDLKPTERCYSQSHRMYYAPLVGLDHPSMVDGVEACRNMSMKINGIKYDTPTIYEDRGAQEGVWGGWLAGDEVSCTTYWEFVEDKGCTAPGSGLRRYQSKIGLVSPGEDPEMLCNGAPLDINGHWYSHPLSCADWGIGFHGIWNLPDSECK